MLKLSKEEEEYEIKLALNLAFAEISISDFSYDNANHILQVVIYSDSTKQKKCLKTSSNCFDGIIENIRNGDYEMRNL